MRALKGVILLVVVIFAGSAFANINFSTARADSTNVFSSVGSLQVDGANGPIHFCNATYVEYPDGDKTFTSSAHCFFENGYLKNGGPKQYFIRMGFDLRNPTQSYSVDSIRCGSKLKTNTVYEKDECIIRVTQRVTGLTPIKKEYLSLNDVRSLRAIGHNIYVTGFHPARNYNDRLLGANGNNIYDANMSRTWQECKIQENPFENIGGDFLIIHNCATLDSSSGAALIYYDNDIQGYRYIGTHRGLKPYINSQGVQTYLPFGAHIEKSDLSYLSRK